MPRRPWRDADYSPFKAPINAYSRFETKTFLYFVGMDLAQARMKIGMAKDVQRRLRAFQAANPDIKLFAYRAMPGPLDRQVEKLVHQALAHCALGREWFAISLPEALRAATPILARAERVVHRMSLDGVFGYS